MNDLILTVSILGALILGCVVLLLIIQYSKEWEKRHGHKKDK